MINKYAQTYHGTIVAEIEQFAFLHDTDHQLTGKAARKECCQEADAQREGTDVFTHHLLTADSLEDIEQRLNALGAHIRRVES